METTGDIDVTPAARAAAAPALVPAIGVLAGTCAAPHLAHLPLAAVVGLIGLGLALGRRGGWGVAALGLGLLNAALQLGAEPTAMPRRPAEVVVTVASHPVRHDDSTFFHARVRRWQVGEAVRRGGFDLQVTIPPELSPPAIGSVVRMRGYLRRSPGYANDPPMAPGPWRMRLKSVRFLTVEQSPTGWTALAGWLRRRAEAAFETPGGRGRGLALARALLLGDRSWLPPSWQATLRRCGLAHVLAVSGLHVGLLAVVLVLASAVLPVRWRYLPALLGIGVYLLLVGPRPAVLRASLMGLLALSALTLHRPPQALNALACCVAVLALVDPSIVGRLGFQLSVAATAGILVLAPVFAERWTALPIALRRPLAATVAAQLATLPWTVPLTGGVHPLAPVLNLVAVPLLTIILLLAFVWLVLAVVVGSSVSDWCLPLLDATASTVELLARTPPGPAFFHSVMVAGLPAAVVGAAALWRPVWGLRAVLFAGLLFQTGAAATESLGADPSTVEVVMFDVGQGDAILLRDGARSVLIDGGGWPHGDFGGRVLVPALAALGIDRLDAVILTHPDRDHCGGLIDLSRYLPVAEIWSGPGWTDGGCVAELLVAPVRRWRVLWRGEVEQLGRWRLKVLHPAPGLRRGRNDRSLVLSARAPGHRFLLTGDVGAQTERWLVRTQPGSLAAGMLKIAHHGSKSSTSDAFLRAVAPRLALVSAGAGNSHGHPHPQIVERLHAAGIRVLRTDRSGMLRLKLHASGKLSIALPGAPRTVSVEGL